MAPSFELLSGRRRFVYYDARGNGLSDWEMKNISFDLMVDDLEAVFDAAEVEKAPILAISQGCAIAAAFAARRPERVSSIIMIGGYALGRAMRKSDKDKQRAEAICRFVPLDSNCHTIPANDTVWPKVEREMGAFLEHS